MHTIIISFVIAYHNIHVAYNIIFNSMFTHYNYIAEYWFFHLHRHIFNSSICGGGFVIPLHGITYHWAHQFNFSEQTIQSKTPTRKDVCFLLIRKHSAHIDFEYYMFIVVLWVNYFIFLYLFCFLKVRLVTQLNFWNCFGNMCIRIF